MHTLRKTLLSLALCSAALPAAAQFSVGAGAGLDRARVDCVGSFACDRGNADVKLEAGWRIADTVDLQAVYLRTRFDYADPYGGSARETTTQPIGQLGLGYALTPALRLSFDVDVSRFKVHTRHGTVSMFGLAAE